MNLLKIKSVLLSCFVSTYADFYFNFKLQPTPPFFQFSTEQWVLQFSFIFRHMNRHIWVCWPHFSILKIKFSLDMAQKSLVSTLKFFHKWCKILSLSIGIFEVFPSKNIFGQSLLLIQKLLNALFCHGLCFFFLNSFILQWFSHLKPILL